MTITSDTYLDEVEDRARRMVLKHRGDCSSITAIYRAVGSTPASPHNTLRRWVDQARIDEVNKPATTAAEPKESSALKTENSRLIETDKAFAQSKFVTIASRRQRAQLDPHCR